MLQETHATSNELRISKLDYSKCEQNIVTSEQDCSETKNKQPVMNNEQHYSKHEQHNYNEQ